MQNNCPVCSGSSLASHLIVKDHFLTGEDFEILSCKDCGFSFTLNPPSQDDIGPYYKSVKYISHSDTKSGITNRLYHVARKWMLGRKNKIVCRASSIQKGKLLDIGCGTGYFAGYMLEKGWNTYGIEADVEAKKYAEENFGLEVYGIDSLSDFGSSEFDAITLWHVLEHLPDPGGIIKEIYRLLKERGICVIALPNTDSYDAKHYRQRWAAWDVPRHLWHFNQSSFKRLVNESGLILKRVKKMPFDAFYISIISEKYSGSRMSFIKGMVVGKIAWIFSLFNKSKSSSLIYILQKES